MNLKHRPGLRCPRCDSMLESGVKELQDWFYEIKVAFPDAHVSCVWRNESWQNALFEDGKSRKRWPDSKHNKMVGDKPASEAMDLFELNDHGEAEFRLGYYKQIAEWLKDQEAPIRCGVDWNGDGIDNEKWRDPPHFEIKSDTQG